MEKVKIVAIKSALPALLGVLGMLVGAMFPAEYSVFCGG